MSFFDSNIFTIFLMPLIIFVARAIDVGLGTIRVILITRGHKTFATAIAFVEIIIWLLAIRQILTNLDNPVIMIAYAGGFAAGTYLGIIIEGKLSLGKVLVRITTKKNAKKMIEDIRKTRTFVTTIEGKMSRGGKVTIIQFAKKRQSIPEIVGIIKKHNPNAIYTIEDVRYAYEPTPLTRKIQRKNRVPFQRYRKGK